jgi:hypothetical protein
MHTLCYLVGTQAHPHFLTDPIVHVIVRVRQRYCSNYEYRQQGSGGSIDKLCNSLGILGNSTADA